MTQEDTMKKYVLHPAKFKLDGGAMFGIIPKPLWEKKITPDEFNRINMSLRIAYIETENKKILIDTGIGDYHPDKFKKQFDIRSKKSPILSILKEKFDISPDDITDIILSHLHFDHVGGLGTGESGSELIFKNAIIHLHEDHYKYSLSPTQRDSGSFQSHYFQDLIKKYEEMNQLNFLKGNEGSILRDGNDEITYLTSFGHTPHMIHPIFDSYIYMADLVPMSHHVNIPWVMGYDIEPGITTQYKTKFYKHILENKLKMIFEHDDHLIGGELAIDDRGRYTLQNSIMSKNELFQILG